MKKTFALAALGAALAFGSAAVPAPAHAKEIDIASTFPKDMLFLGDGLKQFADSLKTLSGGKLTAHIYGAGELVPALEVLTAVSSGAVPAGYDWMGYWGGSIPVANLAGALPFGPSPEVLAEWMWEGGGLEIVQKAYDAHHLKVLPCVITPAEPAGWFRKEINSAADLQGLKMRIGGLAGRALGKVGVTPQMIPGGEVFVSLDRGRIDAAEFSLPAIDETIQLQKAATHYYFPGWHQPASFNSIILHKKTWDGLDRAEQDQVNAACRSALLWSLTNGVQGQIAALERLETQGTQIKRLPDDVLAVLRKATDEVLAEEMAKDAIFKEAYESLRAHMARTTRWQTLQRME